MSYEIITVGNDSEAIEGIKVFHFKEYGEVLQQKRIIGGEKKHKII
jgi:hypothetical protein